jgi:hypothetical protein
MALRAMLRRGVRAFVHGAVAATAELGLVARHLLWPQLERGSRRCRPAGGVGGALAAPRR